MIANRFHEGLEFPRIQDLSDPRALRRFFRRIHMAGPGLGRGIAAGQEEDFGCRGVGWQQDQGRARLLQLSKVVEIVLLSIPIIDVVRIKARLGAEEH